jgi:hypothetical protein
MTTLEILKKSSGALTVDTLSNRTGRSVGQVTADLTLLEINGQIKQLGGRFEYIPPAKKTSKSAKPKKRSSSKPVKSSGRTVSTEKCGCRTLHRDSGSGRFVKAKR